jgi:redox-sensitive bicupin YhaK (pirin superfamily)
MIVLRPSDERGRFDHGWLRTAHSFSFADYHDPRHMGFRDLRVINEDVIAPGTGFGKHGHRDMEIVTWILAGGLRHEDSLGNGAVLRPGDAQRMTAGRGILHSEFNASGEEACHLLQIWLLPRERGLEPGYEDRHFPLPDRSDRLCPIATPDERDGSLAIHQDVHVYAASPAPGTVLRHELARGRHAWLQVARGALRLNGQVLAAGDGAAASQEAALEIEATEPAELLLFDLS